MSNLAAFLAMIRHAEGTDRRSDPYRVCYAYKHTIASLRDHPAVTGEWKGESISSLGPRYTGMISTAAGAYQIIRATWLRCKAALGLRDFGPDSQDKAATFLIERRGALADVNAGRFDAAVKKCAAEWASLPGAGAGQPERRLADLRACYLKCGGTLA